MNAAPPTSPASRLLPHLLVALVLTFPLAGLAPGCGNVFGSPGDGQVLPSADTGGDAPTDAIDVGDAGLDGSTPADARDGDATAEDAPAPDLPPSELRLSVGTWNVRRFFDTRCDTGLCGPGDYEEQLSTTEFNDRADEIVQALQRVDADVVVLQELETQACLDALQQRLGTRYPVAVFGESGYEGSVDVALLGIGELLDVKRHRDIFIPMPTGGTTQFSREFLEVHLDVNGWRVIVFAAHFKSKANDEPARRLAEAQAAQKIVAKVAGQYPYALVVLGGDLNDVPGSPPLNALEDGGLLARVDAELPASSAWTYSYGGQKTLIDHLYVSTQTLGEPVAGSAVVLRDSWGSLDGSDHAALRARFRLAAP